MPTFDATHAYTANARRSYSGASAGLIETDLTKLDEIGAMVAALARKVRDLDLYFAETGPLNTVEIVACVVDALDGALGAECEAVVREAATNIVAPAPARQLHAAE